MMDAPLLFANPKSDDDCPDEPSAQRIILASSFDLNPARIER
jgi:hypothetical protein